MKYVLITLCCIISFRSVSQSVYIADTAFRTDIGYNGASANCIYTGGIWAGQAMDHEQHWWLADDFTVPAGSAYTIDTVIVYGYERNSAQSSTFTEGYLMIFSGTPGAGGTVIWGDSVTNVLASTSFTGIYRVPSVFLNDTSRPLMSLKLLLASPPQLSAGTYWIAWSAVGSGNHFVSGSFKVLPGRINPPAQNGLQYNSYNGIWESCNDGQPLGFNFIVVGRITTAVPEVSNPITLFSRNEPNPFTETTTISFEIAETSYGQLNVYNAIGQCVATLLNGVITAGQHKIIFNASQLPVGSYYYQIATANHRESKQMIFIR